jgi:hypothetical protein
MKKILAALAVSALALGVSSAHAQFNATQEIKLEWQGMPNPPQDRIDVLTLGTSYSQFTHTATAPAGTTGLVATYAISTFGAGQGDSSVALDDFSLSIDGSANLLENPSFEDPTVDMGSANDVWFRFGSGAAGVSSESTANPRTGSRNIALDVIGANQFAGVFPKYQYGCQSRAGGDLHRLGQSGPGTGDGWNGGRLPRRLSAGTTPS